MAAFARMFPCSGLNRDLEHSVPNGAKLRKKAKKKEKEKEKLTNPI
jgi:hypothetical protein